MKNLLEKLAECRGKIIPIGGLIKEISLKQGKKNGFVSLWLDDEKLGEIMDFSFGNKKAPIPFLIMLDRKDFDKMRESEVDKI